MCNAFLSCFKVKEDGVKRDKKECSFTELICFKGIWNSQDWYCNVASHLRCWKRKGFGVPQPARPWKSQELIFCADLQCLPTRVLSRQLWGGGQDLRRRLLPPPPLPTPLPSPPPPDSWPWSCQTSQVCFLRKGHGASLGRKPWALHKRILATGGRLGRTQPQDVPLEKKNPKVSKKYNFSNVIFQWS